MQKCAFQHFVYTVIDTNIVLDVLACREPFFEQSQAVMQLVAQNKVIGAITASSITDIYYIMQKRLAKNEMKDALYGLMELLEIVDVTDKECLAALEWSMKQESCRINFARDPLITKWLSTIEPTLYY